MCAMCICACTYGIVRMYIIKCIRMHVMQLSFMRNVLNIIIAWLFSITVTHFIFFYEYMYNQNIEFYEMSYVIGTS